MADEVISFVHDGVQVRFLITEPRDVIQKTLLSGRFYEEATLERLRNFIPEGATIVDAGANVGNHTVFFGLFCKPHKIFPFEPNNTLGGMLRQNALQNKVTADFSHSKYALGRATGSARLVVKREDNWGNGHLVPLSHSVGEPVFSEQVDVRALDSFALETVDFLKIDVEGLELEVLLGAMETIARSKPVIFVEVGKTRLRAVNDLLTPLGYAVIDYFCQYKDQINLLYAQIR